MADQDMAPPDYHPLDRLDHARMNAARGRDHLRDAIDYARWRFSGAQIRADAARKRKALVDAALAKPVALVQAHPLPVAGAAALLTLWLLRKPVAQAAPHIAKGISDGASQLLEQMAGARRGALDDEEEIAG